MKRLISLSMLLALVLVGTGCQQSSERVNAVLWVGGYAHEYDDIAERMTASLSDQLPMDVAVVRDGSFLDDPEADDLDVIVMNHCHKSTEGVLTPGQQARLLELVRGGVGVVAVHASYYSFLDWDEVHEFYGPRFEKHGKVDVMIRVEAVDGDHPVMKGVASPFEVRSELYESTELPEDCHVVARARETTLETWHPSVWTRNYGKGRIVTILPAHWPDAYDVPDFQRLLANSVRWTSRIDD